jgi:hypothetical protein
LAETPNAPSGLHHAPGNTVPTELLGVDVLLGVDELLGEVAGTGAGVETPETGRHGAILNPAHRACSTLRIRPCSLRSIDKPHRALIEIQFPK